MDNYDIIIIGGGAAGACAGISAKTKRPGKTVAILEKGERVLSKVLASGNGRCNFSNLDMGGAHYYGENPGFAEECLRDFPPQRIKDFFEDIGILSCNEGSRVYPLSLSAAAVADALRFRLGSLGVEVKTGMEILALTPNRHGHWTTLSPQGKIQGEKVIVTTGGCAAPKLGGSYSYGLLTNLGMGITRLTPVLVQLDTADKALQGLDGVRLNARVTLKSGGQTVGESSGELLFTRYGLSGTVIFSLSKYRHFYKHLTACIDFLPGFSYEDLKAILIARRDKLGYLAIEDFLSGILLKKAGQALMKKAGVVKLNRPSRELQDEELANLAGAVKAWEVEITGDRGFPSAQVTAGGIKTEHFNPQTMESRAYQGLYAAGEILDIFGDCGGYNLHFAAATGILAGESAVL